jgi:hypothetical protein
MKLRLAPSLLLAVLQIGPSTAFAPPASHTAIGTSLNSYGYESQYNEYYNEDEYYHEEPSLYNEQNVDFSRRDTAGAFFRGLTAAGAVAAGSAVMHPWNANAAEFSDGGIPSSSSTASSSAVAPVGAPPPPAQAAAVISKTTPSFKFTPLKTPARSSTAPAVQYRNSLAELNEMGLGNTVAVGAVATAGLVLGVAATQPGRDWSADDKPAAATATASSTPKAADQPKKEDKPWYQPPTPYGIVNKDQNPFANKAQPVPATVAGAPPPMGAAPYGLASGRNYWDNKVLQTAVSLPKPPPKKAPAPPPIPDVNASKDDEKPWYKPPTPYGLVNKSSNPFLKDIQQYCEPGKVSSDCTESIKGYLNNLSATGEAASGEAAGTIVGYLDSLGGKTPAGASAAPSTQIVKQALATGSSPPPASAEKVKDYLDALNIGKKPVATGMVMNAPPSKPRPGSNPFEAYDDRLTNIETRVDSLEKKVDGIADEVFDRMESWRTGQENRWDTQYGSGSGSGGYVVPSPPSPPQKLRVKVTNAPRSTGMGGYLESLNP